ncbi:MAG: hypothetical protein NTU58_00270 [Candidatus Nealsonbacteria bacterium]|nr:hypothetical protein [Candidatus Nealsonbacteria bacterium]
MITLFTVPRAFRDPFNIPQRNSLKSWTLLRPKCEIILFGNEEGVAEVAAEFCVRHVPEIELNEFGTPVIGVTVNMARKLASNPIIGQLTSDIILFSNFTKAVSKINAENFLMVGRRWDLNVEEEIDFNDDNWEEKLQEKLRKEGKLHGPSAIDYFVFSKDFFGEIPPFIIGSPGPDNWMIYHARSVRIPVIDVTHEVTVIHQDHDRPRKETKFYKIERQRTFELAGGFNSMCSLQDADWILTSKGLEKPPFPRRIISELTLFKPWRYLVTLKRKIQKYFKTSYY